MDTICNLSEKSCIPCEGGTPPLAQEDVGRLLANLDGWGQTGGEISKTFQFRNYYETMAFVNAVAWISHRENHHPDLEVGYRQCRVRYTTHAIGGLSVNDFICAAKIERSLLGV
ncbi:MAG: 4a-hydroxytetrahydrobiopterin dehydratase [Betaproteobacteria bacterium HGW-Betaproteobacteria-4]|jgi:4a-hydroxytetrahydrobiopterin dehydratase|nr:MAG: 4a-hydroxytetrahydrobiopterin dehydratase [Betaproteobacteria bacterium HGW-Betaproteobacteria-4]